MFSLSRSRLPQPNPLPCHHPELPTNPLFTSAQPHLIFETLGYSTGSTLFFILRRRFGDPIITPLRWAVLAAAVAGSAFGAKLLFWFEDPQLTLANLHNPAYLIGGKTIVGALAGGLIAVELMKRAIGLHQSTGDLYAIPLAAAIAVGRIGCFLTGLPDNTYGTPTSLPWAVNFGDGIPRHPTQIYEIIFLVALIPFLYRVLKKIASNKTVTPSAGAPCLADFARRGEVEFGAAESTKAGAPSFALVAKGGNNYPVILSEDCASHSEAQPQSKDPAFPNPSTGLARHSHQSFLPGDAFKLFMVAYMSFRLLCDFIKPYQRIFLGLGTIQWVCALLILYYLRDILRWLRSDESRIDEPKAVIAVPTNAAQPRS